MVCKKLRGAVMILATLLSMIASNIQAADETETSTQGNTYWEKSSPDKKMTLTRRMALVGHNCMVSRTAGGISVGTGTANLKYLCDDDLSNHFTVPSVADVSLLYGSPIVGVKDMKHYFSKDTKAGFKISGQSDVLKLSVLQANYQINFYKDGEFLKTSEVEQLGFTVLDLNVGDINLGSDAVDVVAKDQPDEEYDEIALVGKSGIDLSVVKGLEIYYAFVGDAEYSLTNTRIKDYDPNITVDASNSSSHLTSKNLCDDDLTNECVISAGLQLGSSGSASVKAINSEKSDEEVFPEGTEIGFVYNTTKVVSVAPTPTIFLYDKDGNKVCEKAINSTVLGVSLGNSDKKVSIKAPCAFSEAKFMSFGVELLSGIGVKYAFIVPKPISAGHQCEMSPNASVAVCNCDAKYKLDWNKEDYPDATWSMISCETNKDGVKVDEKDKVSFDPTTNMLDFGKTDAYKDDSQYGIDVVMRLTNTDGCYQDITIHYGGKEAEQASNDKKKEVVLTNTDDKNPVYTLGDGTDVGVSILKFANNYKNVLTNTLSDYASYFGGIDIGSTYLCSIKKKDGLISDGSKAVQAGFVTTAKGSGLSLDVLKMMTVKIYNKGEEVGSQVNVDAVAAKLIGSEETHKVRYSINVPAGTAFDEIRLYSNGLLGANLSVLNLYYAYTADEDAVLDDPTANAEIVSFDNTGASINADNSLNWSIVNAGSGISNAANCIDGNLDTYALFSLGVTVAGENKLGINLGQTATKNKQLVIVVDKATAGLGVNLAHAFQVKTYKSGVYEEDGETPKAIETYSDWSVLGTNIITLGDKGYVFLNPKEDYDALSIIEGDGADVLSAPKVYGILLRNDSNADGIPDDDIADVDCTEEQDIVFDESKDPSEKTKAYKDGITMYFKRTFVSPKTEGATGAWNSLVLPVSLNKAQFHKAFGDDAKLAKADKLYETVSDGVEHRIIGFKTVEEPTNDGDDMLISDEPYIIWLSKEFVDAHKSSTESYTTWDEGADRPISGEIYIVDKADGGVSYATQEVRTISDEKFTIATSLQNEWKLYDMDMYGSYAPHTTLPADSYIFNNGDLYHLTSSSHWMKGFRCWLQPNRDKTASTSAKEFSLGISDGETTRIVGITNLYSAKSGKVYNLNGQEVDALTGVQPGIYIVNGKKVVIK